MDAAAPSVITVRPVTVDDDQFLFGLFRAVSEPDEVPPVEPLLRKRFVAHEASQRALHPAATHHVVELDRRPIGQCRLGPHPEAIPGLGVRDQPLVLADLTLHPDHHHLMADVVAALHRHAEWFGVSLWADESACTRFQFVPGTN